MSNPASTSTPTSNSVADASESSDDDTIEYEIEVVTSSSSSSSSSSASSTSDHLEANEPADSTQEANAQPNTGGFEANNDSTTSGTELIINPNEERNAGGNYESEQCQDETAIKQGGSPSGEQTPDATAATAATTSEISNVEHIGSDQGDCTDSKILGDSVASHAARQPIVNDVYPMVESPVAQQQAVGSTDSKDDDESLNAHETDQFEAKATEPQQDVTYSTGDEETKSNANNEAVDYPQLISSTYEELKQQPADSDSALNENRGLMIATTRETDPMQMTPTGTASESEILSTNQIDGFYETRSPLIDDSSRIPSGVDEGGEFSDKDNHKLEAINNENTNDLKTTKQQVVPNDLSQTESAQYNEEIRKPAAEPHRHQVKSLESSDKDVGQSDSIVHQSDSDLHRPSDHDTRAIEEEPMTNSPGPVPVGISVEPPPQQATNTTELLLSMSPDTVFRRESFSEDLEREFDEEPEFEPRVVTLKRDLDARLYYELADELGRGRFGTVYHCRENATGRSLAAKFINVRRSEDREDVEREIGIMSKLQHKRLLQLYDAFDNRVQNEMCLITELIEGGELFERIVDDDFDLTEKKAAVFMRQICEGVEYMHSQHIVHLDMKPENILCLSKTGNRIKLIDFGLARQLDPDRPLHVMFGTPDFAAPEVLSYEAVTFATDMWSIGVICYVLLSGLLPFMGDNDMQTMANVTRAEFEFDEQAFEPISDLAKDFISKLLIKDPSKRLKPSECLQHAWLQRGGAQLEAAVIERRKSSIASLSFLLSGAQQARLEQLALMASSPRSGTGSTDSSRTPTGPRGSISIPIQQQVDAANWNDQLSTCSTADAIIPALFSLSKRNLKRYVIRRKWHKTVHAIMALGRMGATLRSKLVP